MKTFPTLYQKSNGGAIQQWKIEVRVDELEKETPGGDILEEIGVLVTTWGQVDGAQQVGEDPIRKGKNLGRANATTAVQQAEAEAESRWTKKKKAGYVEDPVAAEAGEVDETVILGGVAPMLAPNKIYGDDKNLFKKILYPAIVQPKLDGIRCIGVVVDGKASLWSRTRKPITAVPHIIKALEDAFAGKTVTVDGELYNHDLHDEFQEITSIVGKKGEIDSARIMQYHLYDMVPPAGHESMPYFARENALRDLLPRSTEFLKRVDSYSILEFDDAKRLQEDFEKEGYEGAMIRNAHGPYESDKRSPHLQKLKTWIDAEFKIVGAIEGRGKLIGCVGAFVCEIVTTAEQDPVFEGSKFGATFEATPKCKTSKKRSLWQNPEEWKGKMWTIRFKRWTKDGVAYIPRAIRPRDGE